jgi:hypothetical protein
MSEQCGVLDHEVHSRVIHWYKGAVIAGGFSLAGPFDVRLTTSAAKIDGFRPSAVLSVRLDAVERVFVAGTGPGDPVHSFRYRTFDGSSRWLLLCGVCNDVVTCADEELANVGESPCRKCGAPVSGAAYVSKGRCLGWHNWGTCPVCPDECAPWPSPKLPPKESLDGGASHAGGGPGSGRCDRPGAAGGVPGSVEAGAAASGQASGAVLAIDHRPADELAAERAAEFAGELSAAATAGARVGSTFRSASRLLAEIAANN